MAVSRPATSTTARPMSCRTARSISVPVATGTAAAAAAAAAPTAAAATAGNSGPRPHEAQREPVGRLLHVEEGLLARVGGIAQEVAVGLEHEAGRLEFLPHQLFVDAVQALRIGRAGAGLR